MKKNILHTLGDKTTEFFDKLIDDRSHFSTIKTDIVHQFHQLYYHSHFYNQKDSTTSWLGIPTEKCPLDLWIFQEILFDKKPDLIIECGTGKGGTTIFLASICDLMNQGKIISVDINQILRPVHSRIKYLHGNTTDEGILTILKEEAKNKKSIMVILDDDHHRNHVYKELLAYQDLVSKGNYLIVEDTNLNGNPVFKEYGAGPMEAVSDFLKENHHFESDKSKEKYFLTFNPNGYLKRIS